MDIVFTHDIHSYLDSYEVTEAEGEKDVGGMARLSTLLKEMREKNPDTLVLDAGDFSMGTLFHTVFVSEAMEYRILGQLGFDATTFGNHEFDFGSEGLASMLNAASEKQTDLAPLVVCNIDWNADNEATKKIKAAADACGLADYIILQKGEVKVAVTGVFGKDAYECAPTCELTVLDPVESVKETVARIQKEEQPDLIVCISHSGTWSNPDQSEDEQLARAVPELDVIISGHTHTVLEEPIVCGNTCIASCGAYGRSTGVISLTQAEEGRWLVQDYELVSMDEEIAKDSAVQASLDEVKDTIDSDYLNRFGYAADQVLAENTVTFEDIYDLEALHTEHVLGDFMADAYRSTIAQLEENPEAVDVAVVPAGVVRGTYGKGAITVADVFDSFSLGSGADQIPGYPLISVYLTGEELRTAAEVDASISDFMVTARLYLSGLSFAYNPNRMILDRVTDIWQNTGVMGDDRTELEPDHRYRVVTDLYTGRMLSAVAEKSMGILKLVPKHADGTPVESFEDCIIYDQAGREVKAWTAIAAYMQSFPQNEKGISQIPAYYENTHGRKVVENDKSLAAILRSPGKYGRMIYGILAGVVVVLTVLITVIVKLVRKRRRKSIPKKQREKKKQEK